MKRVILPFKLASTQKKKAVSEITFSVDSQIQNFSSITVTNIKFMKIYDEEKYNMRIYPASEYFGDTVFGANIARAAASIAGTDFNHVPFGHTHNKELKSMDEMPHIVEISIDNLTKNRDRQTIGRSVQGEYQTTDTEKERFVDVSSAIQSILTYTPNIRYDFAHNAYTGVISCNMDNLGAFNIRGKGFGDTFTIKASMYDFRGLAMSEMPSIELTLLFR